MSRTSSETTPRTVITLDCSGCDELAERTVMEHARDSPQVSAVVTAHETLVDEHEAGPCAGEPTLDVEEKRAN